MSIVLKNNVVFKNNIFTNEKIIRLKSSIQNVRKKKKTTIDSTRVFSPFRSFVRTTMIGMERNPGECNLRWNKRVKSESKDGWMVEKSGRSLQEARRLKKTRNRGGRGR